VYFACKAGNFVLRSPDTRLVDVGSGRFEKVKDPGLEITFYSDTYGSHTGVSRPLDPERDKDLIEAARKEIANPSDDRVRIWAFREIEPLAPPRPQGMPPNWDSMKTETLVAFVAEGGLDVEACIAYEEYYGNRADLIAALEALAVTPAVEDPLTVPEL
jgi:hypothetical protein